MHVESFFVGIILDPCGTSWFCFPRISMFTVLMFQRKQKGGNKIYCSDQSFTLAKEKFVKPHYKQLLRDKVSHWKQFLFHLTKWNVLLTSYAFSCSPDYPEFPRDFVWKNDGSMGRQAICLRIYHPSSTGWKDNYLCYRKDKQNLQLR